MARDATPQGARFSGKTAGLVEWPVTRADTGESIYVTSRRLLPGTLTVLVTETDTGLTFRETGKLGYVEPHEEG